MPNSIITPAEAAKGILKIARQQIKEMEREGMSKKEIQRVMDAAFGGLMYGPM